MFIFQRHEGQNNEKTSISCELGSYRIGRTLVPEECFYLSKQYRPLRDAAIFTWVFIVCQNIYLGVVSIHMVKLVCVCVRACVCVYYNIKIKYHINNQLSLASVSEFKVNHATGQNFL